MVKLLNEIPMAKAVKRKKPRRGYQPGLEDSAGNLEGVPGSATLTVGRGHTVAKPISKIGHNAHAHTNRHKRQAVSSVERRLCVHIFPDDWQAKGPQKIVLKNVYLYPAFKLGKWQLLINKQRHSQKVTD